MSKHHQSRGSVADGSAVDRMIFSFSEIDRPGAYVVLGTGHLMRIPPDALAVGRSPLISIAGNEPMMLCLISNDPWIPIGEARSVAAGCDLACAF